MRLSVNQLKKITTGAVNIKEENGIISFNRFTKEQENLYKITSRSFYERTFAPAGVKFYFKTDSKNMFIKIKIQNLSPRKFFSVDVFVDECLIGYLDNFTDTGVSRDYTRQDFPIGEFSKNFILGDGEKTVCVHLPYSVKMTLEEISLDDNAFIKGIKHKKKLLAFGDSITQGFDALRPSNRYIVKLADRLGAEEINKGIGGEGFFPELAKLKEPFVPDYITVAYGTNDWGSSDKETFRTECKAFLENLSESYPDIKIFVITPVWRKDCNADKKFGPFEALEQCIREAANQYENINVISGHGLIPEDENYFGDLCLHPNDDGFEHYSKNLYDRIKNEI